MHLNNNFFYNGFFIQNGFTEAFLTFVSSAVGILLTVGIVVLSIVAMWNLFEKAGIAGWKSIIPFYNIYLMAKIAFGNGWWFLLLIIPIVRVFYNFVLCVKLAKAYGKGFGFALGLFFLNTIFILILGLGDSRYIGPLSDYNYGPNFNPEAFNSSDYVYRDDKNHRF